MQAAFYFSDDLQSTAANPSCFSNCLQPQKSLQPAPSPVGEGILQIAATFPKFPNCPNTSLVACCPLSNSLPRGERTGWLLGLRVLRENRLYWLLFSFSDGLKSTVANPSCFSNRLQPQNLLQPAPSPVGEGWGEGILQISATFPNTLTAQNTSLAACCPLSNSLPRGERTGDCWD